MSYNTPATAEAILGQEVAQELLDEALSIIDSWTAYRWRAVTETLTLSSNGIDEFIYLKSPIRSVTSLTVDDVAWVEDTNFFVHKATGKVALGLLDIGDNNIVVTYVYGFTTDDPAYSVVRGVEARIALLLKKNPLAMAQIAIEGGGLNFGSDPFIPLLIRIPRDSGFMGV